MSDEKETTRLLGVVIAADEAAGGQPTAVASANDAIEREWDGHVLQCCGSGDRHGISAFASTVLCMPCTLMHNLKAALPGRSGFKLVCLLFLAVTLNFCYHSQVHESRRICEPFNPIPPKGPHDHHPDHHPDLPGFQADPETESFLAGATFNPAFLQDEALEAETQKSVGAADKPGFTVMVNGQPIELSEEEATNAQIVLAKSEALEGMNSISLLGRKMLHKHDDDEPEWKHKKHEDESDDDEDDDDEDDDDDDDDNDDEDEHHHTPAILGQAETFELRHKEDKKPKDHHDKHHPKDGPGAFHECQEARKHENILFWIMEFAWAFFLINGFRMRKAIRKQLNIKGSACKDYMSWVFCTPCAIAQETRTLTKNNVVAGIWHNPTILVSRAPVQAPAEQAPLPQKM